MSDADLIQASTVLLLRDGPAGTLEVLMVKRNSKIAFGGLWVFPGGRVDDHEMEGKTPEAAALVAAVREAEEETALKISADDLIGWSHWVPPPAQYMPTAGPRRRFATWFFVAPAPDGAVTIDGGEIHDHEWFEPASAIAKRDAGEIEIVPPTWVTLHQLSDHSSVADALEWARNTESERFTTRAYVAARPPIVAWHGDAGYDTGEPDAEGGRHRLVMDREGWRYERSF